MTFEKDEVQPLTHFLNWNNKTKAIFQELAFDQQ